jgi:hypothetical protein
VGNCNPNWTPLKPRKSNEFIIFFLLANFRTLIPTALKLNLLSST